MNRTPRWIKVFALSVLVVVVAHSHWAQSPETGSAETTPSRLHVSPPIWVSGDRPSAPHVEPYLAAHPEDPSLLVGAAVTVPEKAQDMDQSFVSVFRSADAGQTWDRSVLMDCQIDPWVAFGSAEQVFVSCLGREPGSVWVYRSTDGGKTWLEPPSSAARRAPGADRPIVVAGAQRVYVALGREFDAPGLSRAIYGPALARSLDVGRSFLEHDLVFHDNLQQQPIDAAVLPDGTLLMMYMDFLRSTGSPLTRRRTWLSAWEPDRGFRLPTLVFEQTAKQMPWALAVTPDGRLHVVGDGLWTRRGARPEDLISAAESNIFVISSDDRGQTWTRPVTVTPSIPGANFETPAIAVNEDGVLGVAWYDTRHDPSAECFDLYFSASVDGGRTFLPAARLTPETSCPRSILAQRGLAHRWSFGGDYSGLAAAADGRFHVFWADSRSGLYQVWTAIVSIE